VALVEQNAGRPPHVLAASTDNDGRFDIRKVNPGRYAFVASHSGFISQPYQARGTSDGAILALAPGQQVNDVLFRLVRGAVITGRVIDEAGEPMVAVAVSVLQKPSAEEIEEAGPRGKKRELIELSSATTDDRSEYRVFGLKSGDYYIKAAETDGPHGPPIMDGVDWMIRDLLGSQYAPLFYPGVFQLDQAQAVSPRAGEEVQADFAMRHVKMVEVSGRIIAADGGPATHVYVELSVPEVGDWSQRLSAITDAKGEFTIKSVLPGSYILSAQQHDQDKYYGARQKLEVGEEKIGSITIAFGGGASIPGRIITARAGANALDRIHVLLLSANDDEGALAYAEVKKDGSFQFKDVADGSYALQVSGMENGWFVKSARMGGEDVYQKGAQIEKGASAGSLEIMLSSDGAQLEGSVRDKEHDQPIAGAQVRVKFDPETPYNRSCSHSASTDQNGHFSFDALPPGKYRVVAKLPSATPEVPAISSDPTTVTVWEREHQAVQIKLATPKTE